MLCRYTFLPILCVIVSLPRYLPKLHALKSNVTIEKSLKKFFLRIRLLISCFLLVFLGLRCMCKASARHRRPKASELRLEGEWTYLTEPFEIEKIFRRKICENFDISLEFIWFMEFIKSPGQNAPFLSKHHQNTETSTLLPKEHPNSMTKSS